MRGEAAAAYLRGIFSTAESSGGVTRQGDRNAGKFSSVSYKAVEQRVTRQCQQERMSKGRLRQPSARVATEKTAMEQIG